MTSLTIYYYLMNTEKPIPSPTHHKSLVLQYYPIQMRIISE